MYFITHIDILIFIVFPLWSWDSGNLKMYDLFMLIYTFCLFPVAINIFFRSQSLDKRVPENLLKQQ